MLNSKQRAKLRGIASTYETILQAGKNGISDNLIKQIDDALRKREMIKIGVLDNSPESARELADQLAEPVKADVVCVIGSKIVLYRPNRKKPVISDMIRKIK